MNTFVDNVLHTAQNERVRTENFAVTNKTSESALVDLFFRVGAARGQDLSGTFARAYGEDNEIALRVLLWARDARGGAGERNTFRDLLLKLTYIAPDAVLSILPNIPVVGRWDDLLVPLYYSTNPVLQNAAYELIAAGLNDPHTSGLVAKWMPRKGPVAAELRRRSGLTPKQYRKSLVMRTKVVESEMCAKKWDGIKYDHVPSVAMSRYTKAFWKHSPEKMKEYIEAVKSGEKKVNASVVFPHDVLRGMMNAGPELANEQWKALPDYVNSEEKFLPISDVSGSMITSVSGSIQALDVSVGLGIYLAERNKSAFKDVLMTFSQCPDLFKISGTLSERHAQVSAAPWGMNTNLEAAFMAILEHANKNRVKPQDMPTTLIILSDMEFDYCITSPDSSLYENLNHQYEVAGYRVPKVVFWNLSSRNKNFPVTIRDERTALISGYSPTIVKQVLGANLNPEKIMLETVMVDRYAPMG